jgi:hypothetical protein
VLASLKQLVATIRVRSGSQPLALVHEVLFAAQSILAGALVASATS